MKRLLLALSLASCADEELQQLNPRISLCPTANAPEGECDESIDLGEAPIGIPTPAEVFIVNRGTGRLDVEGSAVDVQTIAILGGPDDVSAHTAEALSLQITAASLGPAVATLTVRSSDRTRNPATVALTFTGVPPPQPDVLLCDGDADDARCAIDLAVDLGTVRPTQGTSTIIFVKNVGDTDLAVTEVRIAGSDEIRIASSTREGSVAPGDIAPIAIAYEPMLGGDDQATLTVVTNDPDTREVLARIRGTAGENAPPVAVCAESVTGGSSVTVKVDDLVGVEGTDSSDPEGDPLLFSWSVTGPLGSTAGIVDPAAQNALFRPDVRGSYTITLVVFDSLGQASAPCSVHVEADARFGFRARVHWESGGDVDVHLVESGSTPFSSRDVRYDNRLVEVNGAGGPDDALLLDDATAAPGEENAVIESPAAGTWEMWVHYFDEGELGPADVTAELVLDDSVPVAFSASLALHATCDLWHVADITFPGGTVTPRGTNVIPRCP